jgi:two-component system response regulator (stage 0 sporulation protein F)
MSINEWVEEYLAKPSRLLIVDDSPEIVSVIQDALEGYDCECVCAEDGAAAIHAIRNGKFDLIFLDLILPEVSGIDVLREVKRIAPETPVVIMTGFFTSELMNEASRLGVVSFLRKPIDFTPGFIKQVFQLFKLRGAPQQSIFSHGMREALTTS